MLNESSEQIMAQISAAVQGVHPTWAVRVYDSTNLSPDDSREDLVVVVQTAQGRAQLEPYRENWDGVIAARDIDDVIHDVLEYFETQDISDSSASA